MRLFQLIRSIHSFRADRAITDFRVRGISCNSKSVRPGFLFVAVKGASADGRKFIAEAVGRGARAVIAERGRSAQAPTAVSGGGGYVPAPEAVPLIEVADCRKVLSLLASEYYRNPSRRMKVVGVTGTNGKTTITYLIEAILREHKARPAVIGTINYRFAGSVMPSKNTTPGPIELHGLLARMAKAGATHAVMEVSSHALEQERTGHIGFSAAIFTNLTRDHLDYHRTLERYFTAKARLFTGLERSARAVINADDPYGRRLKDMTRAAVYTYGIRGGDIRAERISMGIRGSSFTLRAFGKRIRMKTPLIGRHNVYNILAAAGWALAEGIPAETVRRAIARCGCVPGRLEKVDCSARFPVFVDYAHTEDALKNVLSSIRQVHKKGRIIVVFGCGGDRDRGKRPKMGRVVSRLADFAVVTSDNPRSEDPRRIIGEILEGMGGENRIVIPDRQEAIAEAMRRARSGDVVLVAGKGHENYQIFADRTIAFDDREAVKACLR